MSSISGIFGNGLNLSQVGSYSPMNQQGGNNDNGNDGSKVGRGGMFASALVQALSQIGVSAVAPVSSSSSGNASSSSASTTADGTTASTQDPQKALVAFLHDLFAALHAQGASQSTSANVNQAVPNAGTDSDGDNDGSGASGVSGASGNGHHHHHGGGLGGIENRLQSLIQQLSSSNSSSNTGAANSTASSTGTTDSTTSALQQDFQNLLASFDANGNQASLTSFLQAISSNLQGNNPGLNVSTKV